ncbi:sensor histidine kinase [Eisenbergiella porci]|uniref:sensor histidine kinase n=1 Tax=Eisenbergiella porci TaxID=2652274 RepID=UPI002A815282|nr:histidine kinase [Eisenbergiella porci]
MKKKFFSMKHKFVIMVASLLLCFVLATTVIWGVAFTREISERGVEYAREMTESANKNVEGYLKKLRLIAYILQNNSLAKPILNKTSYSNDSERLTDMKNMQLLLKAVMTGAEYMQNIYVFTENGMEFSAGGSLSTPDEQELERYKRLAGEQDVLFSVQPARDKYDYPKMMLTKQLDLGRGKPLCWVVMSINCRGIYGIYNEMQRYDAGVIIWDRQAGQEIYRNNLEGLEQGGPVTEEEVAVLAEKEDGTVSRIGKNKVLLMSMQSEVTGWQSIILIPYKQISGQHGKMLSMNAVVLLLLSLTALLLCRILAERFLRNIELLTDAVEGIGKDNLQLNVVITSGDEAEVLYHRFEDMVDRIKEQIIDIRMHEKEKRVLALRALQAQINPHFLYNSLNTIKWMGQMQGAEAVVDAVDALSSIMQVNMSKKTYMTFQEELDYLNKYICMKEFQKAARIKFVCKIEEELRQCYILKMLIQPIVENSLKHGGVMEDKDGYISISIYADGGDVVIDVEDNGRGLSEEESRDILARLQKGDGIGLFNIQKRIQLYYGEEYGVSITGEKRIFTCVSLRIPKRTQAGEEDD